MKDGEDFSEDALFDQAVDGDEHENADQGQQHEEQKPEQQAEIQEQPEAQAERQQVDDNAPQVPSWRVREINEEKRQLAERVKELEAERVQWQRPPQQQPKQEQPAKQPERPDPLLDPEGYAKYVREDIRNEFLAERREESLQRALEEKPEEFKAAYAAAQQANDPALKARMQASRDPGKTLIAWHKEQQTMREVGNDPNAWLEKKLEERLKDPAFLAKAVELARGPAPSQQSNGRPRVELPPSLSGASRANAQLRSDNQDLSDDALFDATTA